MSELRTVRKQSSRRLYYPEGRQFVTLADIQGWVTDGVDVHVIDVATGVDVTPDVLFQVMAAQEKSSAPSMSRDFLLQAIRAGARASGGIVATFLEQSMNLFKMLQEDSANRGNAAEENPTQRAHRFAQENYRRWCAVQRKISRTLASAQSRRTPAGRWRTEMIAPPPSRGSARPSTRSPRPPVIRARR